MLEKLFRSKRMAEVVEGLMRQFAEEHNLAHLSRAELFETFAAYCVVKREHADFEPDDLRIGGPRDLGIDACAVIINDELYTDAADVKDAVAEAPQLRVEFIFVQAKSSPGFEGKVFSELAASIVRIFGKEDLAFPAGPRARNLRDCVTSIYEDVAKFESAGRPRVTVWYASLGTFRPSSHRARQENAIAQLKRSRFFKDIEVLAAGAHELRDFYRDTLSMASAKFTMRRQVELPAMPGVKKAILGVLPTRDLVDKVLKDEHGAKRRWLFDDNMRDFLGTDKNSVNSEIQASLQDDRRSGQFAVLNNGITIVTRSMTTAGLELHLRDPQVVNGCQTCNVLINNRSALEDGVMVTVRIIESTDEDVISAIVGATNRQTAVRDDGLIARDRFQRHLEDYFRSQPADRAVYFERRTNQYGGSVPKAKIITRRHLTQAYAAMWLDIPHRVGRYRALVESHTSDLYQESHDPLPYYTCAAAYMRLGWLLGRGIPVFYRPARFHLLSGIKLSVLGDGPLPRAGEATAASCRAILDIMWQPTDAQRLVEGLLPAIHAALEPGVDVSGLRQVARTEEFGDRFRAAVLDQPLPDRAAA